MRSVDNISQELFDKIRSRVGSIKLGDTNGAQTTDPSQARFFEFQYKHRDLPIGAVTISLNEEGVLQVYFPNSMVEDADSGTADAWYGFLKELSKFSARNMLNYETHNVTKERLDKKDYQFLTQRSQDEVMENKLHGTSQKSFLETGTAKLIIQHSKTVDETKLGARSRNISAIYIENAEGERFKFANNYLPGARAMARHVSNEGHTRDDRGKHIVEIMNEMNNLKTFVRSIKSNDYVTDEQNEIIEAATDRYYGLKDTLKNLASANGYSTYFENWVPDAVEEEGDYEDLKQKLTREVYDERLTDSLPSVRRAMKERAKIREANMQDMIDFANSDDDIEVYDNPADIAELKNYMQFMKNSDMDTSRKNRSILVAIMKYLSNNMTNDAAANALSDIELDDPAQQKIAYQIAKKYLQGKVTVKAPKAKKDLYGKDKTEGVTFESYAQRMEMVAEGTWSLPENEAEAMKIAAMMDNPIALGDGGDDAINALGGLLGDDELFDDLGEAGDKDPEGDARPIIIGWMMEHTDWENPKYSETIKMALAKIRADGNDTMVIPRTFGNVSATQGERMGSNADQIKQNEDTVTEGYEKMVLNVCKDAGIDCSFRNGFLYLDREDFAAAKKAIKDADMDPPKMIAEGELEEADYDLSTLAGKYGNEPVKGKEGILQFDVEDDVNDIAATMEQDPELENFAMAFEKSVYASGDTSPEGIRAALEEVLPDYIAGSRIKDLMKVIESVNEGKMKDLAMHIEDMINDGASDEEIMKMHPEVSKSDIASIRKDMQESIQELPEADEVAESIAKMKAMAGVGSKQRSNHGIHEGEEGYQITPRSIVARQLRKLQDLAK